MKEAKELNFKKAVRSRQFEDDSYSFDIPTIEQSKKSNNLKI